MEAKRGHRNVQRKQAKQQMAYRDNIYYSTKPVTFSAAIPSKRNKGTTHNMQSNGTKKNRV